MPGTHWARKIIPAALLSVVLAFLVNHAGAQTLNLRLQSFNIRLDPAFIVDTDSRRIVDMVHARLITANEKGETGPELAHSWEWVAPNTLRIVLRSGLTFADGKRVTADDVRFSLCRLLQPDAPYSWLFSNVRHELSESKRAVECTGLRVIDDRTIDIEVANDRDRLVPALATSTAAIVPRGAAPGEYGIIPGAGPYKIDEIAPNARVVLKARPGGPISPKVRQVVFQLIQDDSAAATLFKSGKLDALEIANPRLYRLLVRDDGRLVVPGKIIETEAHQIRLLIFNWVSIAKTLGVTEAEARNWTTAFASSIDVEGVARKFSPLAIALQTSYFPARKEAARPKSANPQSDPQGRLLIISENDPFSDAVLATLPTRYGAVRLDYVGLEKSVLVSRLLKKEYDVAFITLEAMVAHPVYWLAFFRPGSPFTIFGHPIEELRDVSARDDLDKLGIAKIIDTKGNWFALFQERRLLAIQPRVRGGSFLATGLPNYATMGVE